MQKEIKIKKLIKENIELNSNLKNKYLNEE
jgi:hypothetical protein